MKELLIDILKWVAVAIVFGVLILLQRKFFGPK
jgi:hypothetical protein